MRSSLRADRGLGKAESRGDLRAGKTFQVQAEYLGVRRLEPVDGPLDEIGHPGGVLGRGFPAGNPIARGTGLMGRVSLIRLLSLDVAQHLVPRDRLQQSPRAPE